MKKRIHYNPLNDFYKRLGVESSATMEDIQGAYRQLAKKLHPDLNPDRREWATQEFQLLNEAYDVLSDPELRPLYDERRPRGVGKSSSVNWWDQPHQPQPGYSGIHTRTTTTPPVKRPKPRLGEWLNGYGLGFLRPVYVPIAELVYSPYRPILFILLVVLLGNGVFIMRSLMVEPSQSDSVASTTHLPPTALPTPTGVANSGDFTLIFCPESYRLAIAGVEFSAERYKILAYSSLMELGSQNVTLQWVTIGGDGNIAQKRGPQQPAELIFVANPPLVATDIQVTNIAEGDYVLEWTPHLPDNSNLIPPCHQVISLKP